LLTLLQGEKFSETKKRLEKRTGLKGKSFEKIKFAVAKAGHFAKPQYLNDGKSHVVS
jgi:ubiquitin carboxyl-terminal hydrolase 7